MTVTGRCCTPSARGKLCESRLGDANGIVSVHRRTLPRSAPRRAARRDGSPGRGHPDQAGLRPPDRRPQRPAHRHRRPHADARPDRRAHPRRADRGEPATAGRRAADPAGGQGLGRHARDAGARLHHAARHRRRRLGHQGRGRAGPVRRPAAVHRRPAAQPDRRARRIPQAHPDAIQLRLLLRPLLGGARRRRRARRGEGHARRAAQGRRPHQAHGLRRRRLAARPAGEPAIPRR